MFGKSIPVHILQARHLEHVIKELKEQCNKAKQVFIRERYAVEQLTNAVNAQEQQFRGIETKLGAAQRQLRQQAEGRPPFFS